ncbi:MAG: hypothetical protein QGD90_00305 [Candidatus Hydrogenedentes bacterium]|nr:hypothetical protein [Candidatus Hydrogenedentota bacterium]
MPLRAFIIALDPSSTFCGWALYQGVNLISHGTIKRGRLPLACYANICAKTIRFAFKKAGGTMDPEVWYEINDRQRIPRERQKSMRKQAQGTGRILQALGVEGHERHVDSKTKEKRGWEASLIYGVADCPVNEHALDAIALGHAIVSDPERLARRHG